MANGNGKNGKKSASKKTEKVEKAVKSDKQAKTVSREELMQEKLDIKDLNDHLEEEYRKAAISDANYHELSKKYRDRLEEIDEQMKSAPDVAPEEEAKEEPREKAEETTETEEQQEEEEEEKMKEEGREVAEASEEEEKKEKEEKEEKPKKPGLFSKLLGGKKKEEEGGDPSDPAVAAAKAAEEEAKKSGGKKKKDETEPDLDGMDPSSPEAIMRLAQQAAGQEGVTPSAAETEQTTSEDSGTVKDIEIEKLKAVVESMRDSQKSIDDSIRNLAESIGEIRSMVFQEDSSMKEESSKLEKLGDEVEGLKPKEIDAKFRDINTKIEQYDISIEKFQRKTEDVAEKVNKAYDMLKSIGGVENLIGINKDIQTKLDDIKEALKYTERMALKTEKIFIDMNRDMQDIVVYKTRQEGLEDTVRDLLKSIDGLNSRLNDFPSKKELEQVRSDMLVMQKQIGDLDKALPIIESKMPETIEELRNERSNILAFLDLLKENYRSGVITAMEYEEAKRKNSMKLAAVERELKAEWGRVRQMMQSGVFAKESSESDDQKSDDESSEAAASESDSRPEEPPREKNDTGNEGAPQKKEDVPEEPEKKEAKAEEEPKPVKRKRASKKVQPAPQPIEEKQKDEEKEKDPAPVDKAGENTEQRGHDRQERTVESPVEQETQKTTAGKSGEDNQNSHEAAKTEFVSKVVEKLEAEEEEQPKKVSNIIGKIKSRFASNGHSNNGHSIPIEKEEPMEHDHSKDDETTKRQEMSDILKKVKEKIA